jgi:general secretion pathway protein D
MYAFLLLLLFSIAPLSSIASSSHEQPIQKETEQNKTKNNIEKTKQKGSSKKEPAAGKADIYLNFKDVSLSSVVNYLADQKGINIVPNKELDSKKVSLSTREPLTLEKAWNILLTLLEMNNFTLINVNDLYRVVPSGTNKKEPLPLYSSKQGEEPENLPNSDLVVRYVYFLENLPVDIAQKILQDMLPQGSTTFNKDLKACIITGKCFQIKAAMQVVKELDKSGIRESMQIIKLKHTDPLKIASMFNSDLFEKAQEAKRKIFFAEDQKKKAIAYFSSSTKIIPDSRNNSLILLGTKQNIDKIVGFIHKWLDIPMIDAKTRIHIKDIKYTKASTIKGIINALLTSPKGAGNNSPLVGQYKFFNDVQIEDETPSKEQEGKGQGNRLIIACNGDDWRRLEKLIEELDKPQPQVVLEVMIVDVSDTDERALGAQLCQKGGSSFAKGISAYTMNVGNVVSTDADTGIASLAGNYAKIPDSSHNNDTSQGETWLTLGNSSAANVWGALKARLTKSSSNLIAQPFLVTKSGNQTSYSSRATKYVQGNIKGEFTRSVEYKPANADTTINLTPYINADGIINLSVDCTINEFQETAKGENFPTTNRVINTQVILSAGEILVIGGLSKDKSSDNNYKTPLLADIPLIGNFFKSKSLTIEKKNLYVFIRPSVIKPRFEGNPDEYTQLKLDYAKHQILKVENQRFERDPVQHWYFKPKGKSIHQTIEDLAQNKHAPVDNFIQGKQVPRSVRIEADPYYRTSENIKEALAESDEAAQLRYLMVKNQKPSVTVDIQTQSGEDRLS